MSLITTVLLYMKEFLFVVFENSKVFSSVTETSQHTHSYHMIMLLDGAKSS